MMGKPKVSVSIVKNDEIKFVLYGNYTSKDFDDLLSGKCVAKLVNGKIRLSCDGKDYDFSKEIKLVPSELSSESFVINDVVIGVDFHWEQKENQRFQGSLKLLVEDGKIVAVNVLSVENYLISVISSEMSANSSIELLKAHAIISRSWLLAQIDKQKELDTSGNDYIPVIETEDEFIKWYDREDHKLYDVCNDDHCQRYQGITKAYTEKVRAAVNATEGMVLKYKNKICDARFSKSCGGIAEDFENVWEPVKHDYLVKTIDYKYEPDDFDLDLTKEKAAEAWIRKSPAAFCNTSDEKILSQVLLDYDQETTDFYRWKVEYSQNEIAELINGKSAWDFGDIIDLIPIERGVSGRLIKLKIVGSKKTLIIGKELEIRRILSKSHLYSSAFVIDKDMIVDNVPGKFILTGAGWGHGVGLCQIGAAVMGEMGYSFDAILLHYFKGASIQKDY
ncbi:MAG: SpoIID/LytB domain-containing protein [Melioribacteraceae bacterium]|nr:SpoIID/LytB domain-containing protein [Melioribacteraceae bacterium]